MPSTRTPVAIGSRVPACPTLRVAHSRRARPTTSWLVHPAGLSTTSSPSGAGIRAVTVLADAPAALHRVGDVRLLGLLVGVGVAGILRRRGCSGHSGVALLRL